MRLYPKRFINLLIRASTVIGLLVVFTITLQAQMNDRDSDTSYANMATGEFTPTKGFQLAKTEYASLNLSIYGMSRYLNQMSPDSTWVDHLGNTKEFIGRNDIYWHRAMIWFNGFAISPKLTYQIAVWTVSTTQQTLVYGTFTYRFNKYIALGAGMTPNVCIRSVQGNFPFFSATDRTMAEDGLRGGFTNGVFVTGEALPGLRYTAVLGNNLSILGVKAANLKRHFSKSISINWMPTTHEFGPRGGNGDFENHNELATRFGVSYCHYRDNRFNNEDNPSPDNTQVRMSDGGLFFETGALAPGVTVIEANYDLLSVDLGFKYKGFALHSEFYYRTLSKFNADGPVPINFINDNGYKVEALYMAVPKVLCVYGVHSMILDEFNRKPYEVGGGVNIYPLKTRSWRLNAQVMRVYKSAAGGTFGLYTTGHTGTTLTIGTDIFL
ncbi:MAG: hypothetical protein IPM71_13165 [Bacteroidota bacterium]|nr:MAG: hypothetical protein IPM71_13165 [Bacteroidota bacterium]